ncbi:MAG: hypothetical protein WC829_06410 [Hyphomicrobium sp.]
MTECKRALSAYVPTHAPAPNTIDFTIPLQVYIIETIERETRARLLRQFALVATLVAGMFVGQWPVAFSSANAVPGVPISAHAAGARTVAPELMMRLAFAPGFN